MAAVSEARRPTVCEALCALARNGFEITFKPEIGGEDAAWSAFYLNVAAGRDASIRRANDYDPGLWTLEVRPWA
jgi:hypothetical protein